MEQKKAIDDALLYISGFVSKLFVWKYIMNIFDHQKLYFCRSIGRPTFITCYIRIGLTLNQYTIIQICSSINKIDQLHVTLICFLWNFSSENNIWISLDLSYSGKKLVICGSWRVCHNVYSIRLTCSPAPLNRTFHLQLCPKVMQSHAKHQL